MHYYMSLYGEVAARLCFENGVCLKPLLTITLFVQFRDSCDCGQKGVLKLEYTRSFGIVKVHLKAWFYVAYIELTLIRGQEKNIRESDDHTSFISNPINWIN